MREELGLDRDKYEQFCIKQGTADERGVYTPCPSVTIQGRYDPTRAEFIERDRNFPYREIFQNGALVEGVHLFDPPPSDSREFLLLRQEFLAFYVDREEQAIHDFKRGQLDAASWNSQYANKQEFDSTGPARLKVSRGRIKKWQAEIDEISAKLEDTPEIQRVLEAQEAERCHQDKQAALLGEITAG